MRSDKLRENVGDGFPVPFRPYSAQTGAETVPCIYFLAKNYFRERKLISDENERNEVKRGANCPRGLPRMEVN